MEGIITAFPIDVLFSMSEISNMRLCGEYVLLETIKNISDNSNFKLPETIKIHERFQCSRVLQTSSGEPAISSEKIQKYNIICKSGDIVMFRASSAEQIVHPFTQEEFLIVKNSEIIAVFKEEK